MEIFFLWVGLSVVAGMIAGSKDRGGPGVFFISLILSPLIGLIIALSMRPLSEIKEQAVQRGAIDSEYRKCPFCAEAVRREAIKCKHCGSQLEPVPDEPPISIPVRKAEPAPPPPAPLPKVERKPIPVRAIEDASSWPLKIVIGLIACIVVAAIVIMVGKIHV